MDSFKKNIIPFSHLPSIMLIIGYPIFWAEVFWHKQNHGLTTPLAWIIFLLITAAVVFIKKNYFVAAYHRGKNGWDNLELFEKGIFVLGLSCALVILFLSAYAASFPPHLMQEEDVLNYHYSLPRQHLIRNSTEFIPWAMCDLFPFPIQFALSSFWFATVLPNKIPQFFFLLGLLGVILALAERFIQVNIFKKMLLLVGILSAHHVGIQAGTAMLDLVIAYAFLAALDSFLQKRYILAGVEFSFYFWSKSFIPFQTLVILGGIGLLVWGASPFRFQVTGYSQHVFPVSWREDHLGIKKFILVFILSSIFVAAPFLSKSLFMAGTPSYPFFVNTLPAAFQIQRTGEEWQRFLKATQEDLDMKDAYGVQRDVGGWLSHFWLVAVPEQDVNNRFDYPLGLTYLLCFGPFLWLTGKALFDKKFPLLNIFIILFWMSWWIGSQQSRFLYIPMLCMYLVVLLELKPSRVFGVCLLVALISTTFSVARAHRMDWGKAREAVLRPADREMVKLSQEYLKRGLTHKVFLKKTDFCYAQFPLRVTEEKFPYIIPIH